MTKYTLLCASTVPFKLARGSRFIRRGDDNLTSREKIKIEEIPGYKYRKQKELVDLGPELQCLLKVKEDLS